MQSAQSVAAKKRTPQRPISYGDEQRAPRAATATPRAATSAPRAATATPRAATSASSTGKQSIKERIKSAIKSVKEAITGNKKTNKSELVLTVERAVSKNLKTLQEEVLADVEKIEGKHPDISNRDKNDDFISQIDETVKGLAIHLHKALEYTEHTRALFGQEPDAKQGSRVHEPEQSQVKVSPQVAKSALTKEEQENLLFKKVNNLIEVLATYLADTSGKSMLKFSKNNDTPVKYTLTITKMSININYTTLNELLKIISDRIQFVIMLCFLACGNELKKALKAFETTSKQENLDIKDLYFDFLNILSIYIEGNRNLRYKVGDKIATVLPIEISTLLNDRTVGGKKHKRKPKKVAASAAKKRKASKSLVI